LPSFEQMANAEPAQATAVALLWRRATWLGLLFVVYGSLVPLNFQPLPWSEAVARFWAVVSSDAVLGSRVDIASNVLLSMPLAFAAAQWLLAGRGAIARWVGRAGIVLGVLLVAMSVEFTQQFFPPRTLSLTDIQAQLLGAVLALLAQWRWGNELSVWVGGWWGRERTAPRVERALKAYLLVLLGFSLLPLDLTINPVEIYQKWSQGGVIWLPFSGLRGAVHEQLYEMLIAVLIWLPVGALLGLGRKRSVWQVVGTGALMALVMEVLQLFVHSRVTDSTNVLLAALGVGLGAQLVASWTHAQALPLDAVPSTVWRGLWWCWFLVVLAVFWYPFAFAWPSSASAWDSVRVPFATYQMADEFRATNEALTLRRLGFFLPGGLLWGFWAMTRQRSALGWWPVAGVAVLVEAGQVFLPGKVADLTDAGLAALGAWLGWRLAAWLWAPPVAAEHRVLADTPPAKPAMEPLAARGGLVVATPLMLFLGMTLALVVFARLPGMPYNVRELVAVGPWGLVSAAGLSFCLLMGAWLPLVVNQLPARWVLWAPVVAPLSGAVAYAALRQAVPLESLHDVVGSPVLGWPWEWERLLRFMALWAAGVLAVGLAGLLVALVLRPQRLAALINGALVVLLMLYPLHLIIVRGAATDNLTELLADQGSLLSLVWVGTALWGLALAASALSAWRVQPDRWRSLMVCWLVGAALAPWGLLNGLESAVIKYGQVFSALQFLLSAQRAAYVEGLALWLRLAFVLLVAMFALAALQHSAWKRFLREKPVV
jgi:glycopeptide antibiotics resistance protein